MKHVFTTLKGQLNYCIILGSTIHPILQNLFLPPIQRTTFFGYDNDSVEITLEITVEEKNQIHNFCSEILQNEKISFHKLASVIGNFVASFPVFPLTPIFIEIWNIKK